MLRALIVAAAFHLAACFPGQCQVAPTPDEIATYTGIHAAVIGGSAAEVEWLVQQEGADVNGRDRFGRTPLMVAAYRHDIAVARTLIALGANVNALEHQSYDAIAIAVVENDLEMLALLLASGANARAVTSPYGSTALIAAARLGHAGAVEALLAAGAPVDHVDYLGQTALTAAIVYGDGSARFLVAVKAIVSAGADVNRVGQDGTTPLALARSKGFSEIIRVLEQAGGRS